MNTTQRGGTLLGIALGLLAGVLISFAVVWHLNRTPLPFVDRVTRAEPAERGRPPVALPGKPGDKPLGSERQQFEFYDMLEEGQRPAPGGAPAPAPALAEKPAVDAGSYLQVGAFQNKGDADKLRARLALLGFATSVVEVGTPDKGIMHRVRLGPFAHPEEMNRARAQLSQQGVPATVVRGKD
ncbi:MAG: SPOR domain-containing protein [Sulfuritalea sp.]|nr:SPOR domain-containing protein [Sulfuritalea sp.]